MRIAIHHSPNSFSKYWLSYCSENSISYKIVDCHQSDIVEKLRDCDILLWHFNHNDFRDMLFAKQLLISLELAGKKVFPDYRTCWHFNDKVGQKYLFESIDAPFVPSYVFYNKAEAISWASQTSFPKVFKLRGGAGSENVVLVKTRSQAVKMIEKAFSKGFRPYDYLGGVKERIRKYKEGNETIFGIIKSLIRLVIPNEFDKSKAEYARILGNERGYIYFQDFVPGNNFDIRVVVIDKKAFALKRMIRKNDFRASGSGHIIYEKKEIDENCVKIAFDIASKIKSQSAAFDFVFDINHSPKIIEVSFGFSPAAYFNCPGYWDEFMHWHEGNFNPYGWIIEQFLQSGSPE